MAKGRNIRIIVSLGLGAGLAAALAFLHVATNAWHIHATSKFLRSYSYKHLLVPSPSVIRELEAQLIAKSELYISEIQRNHLDDGLVINRSALGKFRDNCDSLLFSSLLHTALIKLEHKDFAAELWQSIRDTQQGDLFIRHPDCADKATSRDQILGLLVALSQKPEGHTAVFGQLFDNLKQNNGYFSHGSTFVSYMTPGLADITRRFARVEDVSYETMPDSIRRSFSTVEVSVPLVKKGYRTHLSALQIWLEMELETQHPHLPEARSVASASEGLFSHFVPRRLGHQRLEYLTQTLVERQPENLFYRYLRFRAADALSPAIRARFMTELLTSKHFPATRVPADCDRHADYLWQRDTKDYQSYSSECKIFYSGVDFVWMAALLLEKPTDTNTAAVLP